MYMYIEQHVNMNWSNDDLCSWATQFFDFSNQNEDNKAHTHSLFSVQSNSTNVCYCKQNRVHVEISNASGCAPHTRLKSKIDRKNDILLLFFDMI